MLKTIGFDDVNEFNKKISYLLLDTLSYPWESKF